MFLGVAITYFFVPDDRGVHNESLTLEEMSLGWAHFEDIRREKKDKVG